MILFEPAGTMDCVVRNLSAAGACLEVSHAAALPPSFVLIIKPEIARRICAVVWRAPNRIGVRFTEPSPPR